VTARILHISDLHLGRRDAPEPLAALGELVTGLDPELLVVTGDLAHRGRRAELERAGERLRGLGVQLLAVPGNHDIPYTFPARFTRTFAEWERVFGATEPTYDSERFTVVGLNSVREWRHQSGALGPVQLGSLSSRLRAAGDGALRVVALHHHLAAPPWRSRKRPVTRRDQVLRALADAGAELVLAGHVHQAGITARREFEALDHDRGSSVVLATVAGFSRPRPRRRGEALGVNVYEADAESFAVVTYTWDGRGFTEVGRRAFPRG
jgi:3',5'-cyclic AMP phosphodiesterase CpdA